MHNGICNYCYQYFECLNEHEPCPAMNDNSEGGSGGYVPYAPLVPIDNPIEEVKDPCI